jgi:hypothetical protein
VSEQEYDALISNQIKEAEEIMIEAEHKLKEAEAKYDALVRFRQNYREWVKGL